MKIILSDTVGFISDLPTMLVAAFRATLEEVIEADVILHVRDVSHEDTEAQSHDVEEVLSALGIDPNEEQRLIEVWNKIDRLDADGRARLKNLAERQPADQRPVLVSALTGQGADELIKAIEARLGAAARGARSRRRSGRRRRHELAAPPHRGDGEIARRGWQDGDDGAGRSDQDRGGEGEISDALNVRGARGRKQ